MTFGCWAMVAVLRDDWRRAGWLFGIGIAFQPLIALTIPLFLAATPRGQRVLFALRCSALSALLVGVAFLGNPSATYRALVEQPTPPSVNHATPWVSLAPHVSLPGALVRRRSGQAWHTRHPVHSSELQRPVARSHRWLADPVGSSTCSSRCRRPLCLAPPSGQGAPVVARRDGSRRPLLPRGGHDPVLPDSTPDPVAGARRPSRWMAIAADGSPRRRRHGAYLDLGTWAWWFRSWWR